MIPSEREAIDRFDAYLEAIARGQPTPGDGVQPDLLAVDHWLRGLSQRVDPYPDFAGQLWSELMQTIPQASRGPHEFHPTPRTRARAVATVEAPAAPGTNRRRRVTVAHLATAAVLLLSLALNALAFGMFSLRGGDDVSRLPALPAVDAGPVAFAWLTRGAPNRMPLADPYHLAIDPDGNVWVIDPWMNQFAIFAPDGTFREAWGTQGRDAGQFNFFNVGSPYRAGGGAVAFDPAGNLYVLDPGNFRVQKFSPDRRFLASWGSEGEEDGQFLDLIDVEADARGRVYVLDAGRQDIQVFEADGQFVSRWGSDPDEGGLRAPSGLAIDGAGNLVVADSGNQRLQTFSPDGDLLATRKGSNTDLQTFRTPADVAVDDEGRLYVTDPSNNRVVILDDRGQLLAAWGEPGSEPGQFAGLSGIALDAAGMVYVAEDRNNRVQAFRLLPPFDPAPPRGTDT